MNTIGENIAYFRKQKKMTQEELAEKMSVTPQAVSKWECNSSYPDITVMHALAKMLFNVAVSALTNIGINKKRFNFLPAFRHFIEYAQIKVAVNYQRKRARNRRCRHNKRMRILALGA